MTPQPVGVAKGVWIAGAAARTSCGSTSIALELTGASGGPGGCPARAPASASRVPVAAGLCVCAVQASAQVAGKDWQALMDQHAVLMRQGQYQRSADVAQKALVIAEKRFGKQHLDVALTLTNLAISYHALGRYRDALPLCQRVLTIYEKVYGQEHPYTAQGLENLAEVYSRLAQHHDALPLRLRALKIRENSFGSEHVATARSMNDLAATYSYLADYEKALPLQQRALVVRQSLLDPDHPDTAQSLNNLELIRK